MIQMPTGECVYILKGEIGHHISSLTFNDQARQYDVLFDNGEHYSYSPFFVDILPLAKTFNDAATVVDRKTGAVFNVTHISAYKNSKYTVCRLFYEKDGAEQHCDRFSRDIDIELGISDRKSKNVLGYLIEVANHSVIPLEEGQELSLGQKYAQLGVVYEHSMMAAYLNPGSYKNTAHHDAMEIFPFGCNSSQYKAVKAALNNNLSIIQGPPGTGKTQTILNIVANLLLAGKSMQIVSNNNSAVENVKEKLAQPKYGFDFLVAQLGRKANKEMFIAGQTGEYPKIDDWHISNERKHEIADELPQITEQLLQLYAKQERLAIVEQELMEHEVQKSHLQIPDDIICPQSLTSAVALNLMNRCSFEFERKGKLGLFTRLNLWLKRIRKQYDVVNYLQALYFVLKIAELQYEKAQLQIALQDMASLQKRQEELSMEYLKGCLEYRYSKRKERRIFASAELRTAPEDFLKEYPIVLSTTFSASGNIGMQTRFDYLIMDEASQVDVASGALALNSADNAVIVGDIKQLPNVITDDKREEVNKIHARYRILMAYHFTSNSFLESVCRLFPGVPNTLLKEHYRCHPLIIGFCNRQFYDGELIPMKKGSDTDNALMLCMTSAGHLAHGASNLRQAEIVATELVPQLISKGHDDIGVIAPYNRQVSLIKEQLVRNEVGDIPVATVHKFQGRENDAIILSTVDNELGDFVNDAHLLNVAVSRAKDKFVLLVSGNEQKDSNIKDLMDYIRYYNGEEYQSSVRSVFDLLYGPMTEQRMEFLKEHRHISEFDSENLMYGLLYDTIHNSGMTHLGILCHYPLSLLITDTAKLTDEERTYAGRNGTHLDFLVYNMVSRAPLFAIEVDGYTYHNEMTEQASRDKLKNSIMAKIGLRLERFRTDGSGEKERISAILKDYSQTVN